jgi:hypothetical protein
MKVLYSQEFASAHLEGIVPYPVTAKASARQTPGCVPWFVPRQGTAGGDDMVKSH